MTVTYRKFEHVTIRISETYKAYIYNSIEMSFTLNTVSKREDYRMNHPRQRLLCKVNSCQRRDSFLFGARLFLGYLATDCPDKA